MCRLRCKGNRSSQQARLFELRAATSLARIWCDQGKRNEARELLAPVYGWFTEGFDTRDLEKAKTLLDENEAIEMIGEFRWWTLFGHLGLISICAFG
jgi:predicted ATPase